MLGSNRSSGTSSENRVLSTVNITSTGTQNTTVPAGVVYVEVEMFGGGGGGGHGGVQAGRGGSQVFRSGGGGGGGAYVKHRFRGPDFRAGDILRFTVGEAGNAAINNLNTAGNGDATQFSLHLRGSTTITTFSDVEAGGGIGGASEFAGGSSSGNGGEAQNGNLSNIDAADADPRTTSTVFQLDGTAGTAAAGPGGGAGGGAGTASGTASTTGVVPGGGGGGCASNQTNPSDGADGKVIVTYYG